METIRHYPINKKFDQKNILLFFVLPIAGFINSIRNFPSRISQGIILFFFAMFGYSYVIPGKDYDIVRIIDNFKQIANKPFTDFFFIISNLYTSKEINPDIGLNLISFIISRFSDSQGFFIMSLALIAGVILLKILFSQNIVFNNFRNINSFIFLIFLIFLLPIYNIGQFRFYAATLFFVLGSVYFFTEPKSIKYFLLSSISMFFHFSYALPVILLLIYISLGNLNKIYFLFLILSFILSKYTIAYLDVILYSYDLGGYEPILRGYTSKSYFEQVLMQFQTTEIWLLKYYRFFNKYFFFIALLAVNFSRLYKDQFSRNLISFSILLFSMINYFEGIRDINQRFSVLFSVLISILLIRIYVINKIKKLHIISALGIILLVMNSIVVIRYFLNYTNITLFLPTPFIGFILDSQTSIYDFLNLIK